jgi:hypothetical protein
MLSFELSTEHQEKVFDVGQMLEESKPKEAPTNPVVSNSTEVMKSPETPQAVRVPKPSENPRPKEEPKVTEEPQFQGGIQFIQEVIKV